MCWGYPVVLTQTHLLGPSQLSILVLVLVLAGGTDGCGWPPLRLLLLLPLLMPLLLLKACPEGQLDLLLLAQLSGGPPSPAF